MPLTAALSQQRNHYWSGDRKRNKLHLNRRDIQFIIARLVIG